MSDKIYTELSSQIRIPELNTRKMIIGETNPGIGHYLSTKQIIHLSKDETGEVILNINNGNIINDNNVGEYLNSLFADYDYDESDDQLYSNIEDGYDISEYFPKYKMYIPKQKYFNYIFTHPESTGVFNVYNGASADIPIELIKNKISSADRSVIPGNFQFPKTNRIKYTTFKESLYIKKNKIHSYPVSFPAMCVNLPYAYFSTQFIPENIYTYDIDTKTYSFAGMNEEAFLDFYNNICNNGIKRPLFFQIRNGRIISASNEDYLTLLIAIYLKLPTIPVVIYMLNNNRENQFLISDRTSDTAVNNGWTDKPASKETLDLINKICEDKLVYFNTSYYGDLKKSNIIINEKNFDQLSYIPDVNIAELTSEEISYVDFFFNKESEEQLGIPVTDIESTNRQLAEEASNKIYEETSNEIKALMESYGLIKETSEENK